MRKWFTAGVIAASLGAALSLLPPASWASPQRVAALFGAHTGTPYLRAAFDPQFNREFAGALDRKEKYLADSFIELARQENIALDPELLSRYDAEMTGYVAPIWRLIEGVWDGRCSSVEAFAGSQLSELLSVGDFRDLYDQANAYRAGEPTDTLVIGLAAVGILSTAAVPFHSATTVIKGLAKGGRLSQPFRRELTDALASGIDTQMIVKAVPDVGWRDWIPSVGFEGWAPRFSWPLITEKIPGLAAALSSGVQLSKLGAFNRVATGVVGLTTHAGICAAHDALALTQSSADLEAFTRLAEERKDATAALLKLFGRDALVMPRDI